MSEIEVDGHRLRCLVSGSVQPFLEALRGYEVIGLTSTPAFSYALEDRELPRGDGLNGRQRRWLMSVR